MDELTTNSDLAKFIYGKFRKFNLPVNDEIAQDIEQVANDYFISKDMLIEVIQRASKRYENNNNFNYYAYIVYGLIDYGKEKSVRGKKHYV